MKENSIMTMNRYGLVSARLAVPVVVGALFAAGPAAALAVHNVPKIASLATDKGRAAPDQLETLTVVLKLPDRAAFDAAIDDLYDPGSPRYHVWFSDADLERYAPSVADFETVRSELLNHGLEVLSADPHRFSLRVKGSVASIERAFQTELHQFSYKGQPYQAHVRDAELTGRAGTLVDAVAGLERHAVTPQHAIAINPSTGLPLSKPKVVTDDLGTTLLDEITDIALSPATDFNFTTAGATLPDANYWGSVYDSNSKLIVSFTPAQLQAHYALGPLYKAGYDGKGQTIALVEGYGYAKAEADANVAAATFGLPPLNAGNFEVIYPEGKPLDPNAADLTGWTIEIALDIQSAHSIAPGAKIVVVASAAQDNEDQIASLQYIITNKVANTVSNSWENDSEIVAGPFEEDAFNAVLKLGAAAGISFQFSSGDGGDQGLGTPLGAVSLPSNSPYATAVGGTTILNDPYGTGQVVAGWGNNDEFLNLGGVVDPPFGGFVGGAGGGESVYFAKPTWQKSLPGTGRQVPDVSALADPYTGFPLIFTTGGVRYAQGGWGGTSLASPIFTAIWAIADQYNGKPLGQAARAAATLKPGQITDVVPTSDLTTYDVTGTVHDSAGTTFYSVTGLFAGLLYTQKAFPSAVWPYSSDLTLAFSFGTDSSLTVAPGWDNVTGFGEPNGLPFVQAVTGKTKGAPVE
jgi:subtilase family serine protease